ncbi:MAG: ABC transporter substrate-binding protein, partial [Defluviitaleaceae bacterium]|nr:ABC transporter substrate-binding protein [Defluviitaleaceae bacterium]
MRKLMALLVVLLFLLAACMGPAPIAQPSPNFGAEINLPQPEDVPSEENPIITPIVAGYGGHINVGMSLPRTLNPLLNSDPWVDTVLRLIFEPLVVFDADMRPIPNPAITQSITFSHDGRSLAVALRDNIFWEDGTAITARDIAFTIDVLQNSAPQTAVYKQNVANIVSHSVIDNRTLQITLRNPSWATKYMLAFPIISAEYYRPVSMANLAAARNMHPMGNGSFRFHSLEPADRLELIANHDAPGGRPYIDRITAIILRDMDGGQIHAFEQGIIDVLMTSPTDWGRYAARGKNRVGEISGGSFSFFGFNFNRTIFADHSLRSAIAHAFDLDTVLRRYYDHIDAAIA